LLILTGDSFGIKTKEKTIPAIPKAISRTAITLRINLLIQVSNPDISVNIIILLLIIIFVIIDVFSNLPL
jgi:hypothetical protein